MTCPAVSPTDPACTGQPDAQAELSEQAEPSYQAELIRVLVVDADARVRTAIAATVCLEADMSLIGAVADAASAITLAATSGPLVALVDVLLPDERVGLSLVGTLCARARCAVVVMSVDSGVRRLALAAGARTFIEKADDIDALLHSIRTAARSSG